MLSALRYGTVPVKPANTRRRSNKYTTEHVALIIKQLEQFLLEPLLPDIQVDYVDKEL